MFICSVKAGTLRFLAAVLLSVLLFASLLVLVTPSAATDASGEESEVFGYGGIKSEADRLEFLTRAGLSVDEKALTRESFTLPKEFDRVLSGYNEIQKEQGLDLARYRGKTLERYTYPVLNYEGYEGSVFVTLILYKSRIVAADISSADPSGFVHGLKKS